MNILFIVIGSFLIFTGGIIWRYKILEIVPGYKDNNKQDKNGLARWIGINYIIMGILSIINSFIAIIYPKLNSTITIVVFTCILYIGIAVISFGGKKYNK